MLRPHSDDPALDADVKGLVAATPADRDRVVDLVRAGALCLVVLGHWLKQGLFVDDAALHRTGLLGVAEWTHPVTWFFQVMPLVFAVGGYANGLSWSRASGRHVSYGAWLGHRTRRLALPLVPLMALWACAPVVAPVLGLGPDWLHVASKTSLAVTWFLAAYLVLIALTPVTYALWRRWGWWSIVGGGVVAGVVDLLAVGQGVAGVDKVNVLVVWGTLHQCGYAWLERRELRHSRAMAWAAGGCLGAALLLVALGPYGVSMVGVAGFGVDNTTPARVTILLLGWAQVAAVMWCEPWLRRVAHVRVIWWGVAVIGLRAMTIYLWHLTSLSLLAAVSLRLDGVGLRSRPTSQQWWLARPGWVVVLALTTALLVALVGRLEQPVALGAAHRGMVAPLVEVATVVACLGFLAKYGVGMQSGGAGGSVALACLVSVLAFTWFERGGSLSVPRRRRTSPGSARTARTSLTQR